MERPFIPKKTTQSNSNQCHLLLQFPMISSLLHTFGGPYLFVPLCLTLTMYVKSLITREPFLLLVQWTPECNYSLPPPSAHLCQGMWIVDTFLSFPLPRVLCLPKQSQTPKSDAFQPSTSPLTSMTSRETARSTPSTLATSSAPAT